MPEELRKALRDHMEKFEKGLSEGLGQEAAKTFRRVSDLDPREAWAIGMMVMMGVVLNDKVSSAMGPAFTLELVTMLDRLHDQVIEKLGRKAGDKASPDSGAQSY